MNLDDLERMVKAVTPCKNCCVRDDCFCDCCELATLMYDARVLALIACVRAADAMRAAGVRISRQVVLPAAEPDSISDDHALGEFIGIFDGPLQRDLDKRLAALEGDK